MKTGETWTWTIDGLDRFNQDLFLDFQAANAGGREVKDTLLLEVDLAGRNGEGQVWGRGPSVIVHRCCGSKTGAGLGADCQGAGACAFNCVPGGASYV